MRVEGQDDLSVRSGYFVEGGEDAGEILLADILRTVDRREIKALFREIQPFANVRGAFRRLAEEEGSVVHHVAHLVYIACNMFIMKVFDGRLGRTEEPMGTFVRLDAVVLLGHAVVEAP